MYGEKSPLAKSASLYSNCFLKHVSGHEHDGK